MTRRNFILAFVTAATMLLAGTSPAMAARLASVTVEAGADQASNAGLFRLSEQTRVELNFSATVNGNGSAAVHVYQKLPNGQWQRVSTPVNTDRSQNGKVEMTLHAGEYKIEAVVTHARLSVTVDN